MLRRQIEEGFKQNGTPVDLAECIARPLADDLDEDQLVHFFLGLESPGLTEKLNSVATGCGGASAADAVPPRRRPGGSAGDRDRAGDLGEEVVALVVDHDEGREVLHLDLPHRLHAQLRVLQHLDLWMQSLARRAAGPPIEPR